MAHLAHTPIRIQMQFSLIAARILSPHPRRRLARLRALLRQPLSDQQRVLRTRLAVTRRSISDRALRRGKNLFHRLIEHSIPSIPMTN